MNRNRILIAFLSIGVLFSGTFMMGCTPETGVKHTTVNKSSELKSKRTTIDRSAIEVSSDNWKPVQAHEQEIHQRNPFRGFSDTLLAEQILRKQSLEAAAADILLPEQLYPTKDYRVVGIISGTADPKVYIMDPSGNRFILRRGSLIGNNNGSISSIRRDGIEVYERVADKGQYVELPLYDDTRSDKKKNKIQLSLQ